MSCARMSFHVHVQNCDGHPMSLCIGARVSAGDHEETSTGERWRGG